MHAKALSPLVLALLVLSSPAVASTSNTKKHQDTRSVSKAAQAVPWQAATAKAAEPDGLVVVDDRVYTPVRAPTPPAATPAPAAKPAPKPAAVWAMHSGEMLSAVVARWCAAAGWQAPQWQAEVDYAVKADASFKGDFTAALTSLMESYRHAKQPLHAAIYTPQRLVYITLLNDSEISR